MGSANVDPASSPSLARPKDEFDLVGLIKGIFVYRWMIAAITSVAMVCVVAYSFISILMPPASSYLPNQYTASALVLVDDSTMSANSILTAISASFVSGIAGLSDIQRPEKINTSALIAYLVGTNTFRDSIIREFDLVAHYKAPSAPRAAARNIVNQRLSIGYDPSSGVMNVSFTDYDPALARSVVVFAISTLQQRYEGLAIDKSKEAQAYLQKSIAVCKAEVLRLEAEEASLLRSQRAGASSGAASSMTGDIMGAGLDIEAQKLVYTQLKAGYELVKTRVSSDSPMFRVLEPAELPEIKSGPNRGMLCIEVTGVAFGLSVLLALVLFGIKNLRKDFSARSDANSTGL
jgi:uncharacterized protein involved in exopolysaccharide biosynthesis